MRNPNRSWSYFKNLIATSDLPELGPEPRANRQALAGLNQKLDRFIAEWSLPPVVVPLVRSAALLWHDYLDESHAISQNIHTADGSFLHAMMHRREPDYGNAKYWFHRVGQHPCFPGIAAESIHLLAAVGENGLSAQLMPLGSWDPFAFVDACEVAADQPLSDRRIQTLMAIQQIEFDCLLAHLFGEGLASS